MCFALSRVVCQVQTLQVSREEKLEGRMAAFVVRLHPFFNLLVFIYYIRRFVPRSPRGHTVCMATDMQYFLCVDSLGNFPSNNHPSWLLIANC